MENSTTADLGDSILVPMPAYRCCQHTPGLLQGRQDVAIMVPLCAETLAGQAGQSPVAPPLALPSTRRLGCLHVASTDGWQLGERVLHVVAVQKVLRCSSPGRRHPQPDTECVGL